MSYKTLLVHLDDSARCATRVDLALELAGRWNAHLIGLYVVCQDLFEPLRRPDEPLKLAVYERLCEERRKEAEQRFLTAAERAGRSVEWQAPTGNATEAAILHARHADLLVLGQVDPDDRLTYVARNFVEDVVMGSGRPAIVVPYAGDVRTLGENVLIGWDGGREAARAVADAVPLLTRALRQRRDRQPRAARYRRDARRRGRRRLSRTARRARVVLDDAARTVGRRRRDAAEPRDRSACGSARDGPVQPYAHARARARRRDARSSRR
jgi:nucleotide-binding universal stress UspA family protein